MQLEVSHTAGMNRRYPGETVTFFTRVKVPGSLPRFRLRITLPPGLALIDYMAPHGPAGSVPLFSQDEGTLHLIWDIENEPQDRSPYDFEVTARVHATKEDRQMESTAFLTAELEEEKIKDQETATIAVKAKSSYLKYLPALYQEDELMGRLLMLFESILAPVEKQIQHIPDYLDTRLAPPDLLPWLASWTGLVMDHDLPDKRRRKLLQEVVSLYRSRGTRHELQEYLEITTGGKVHITDSLGFHLGSGAFLGLGTTLGNGNSPHMFSVTVRLPPLPGALSQTERTRQEKAHERKIKAIIETEKPAHAGYRLQLEFESDQAAED